MTLKERLRVRDPMKMKGSRYHLAHQTLRVSRRGGPAATKNESASTWPARGGIFPDHLSPSFVMAPDLCAGRPKIKRLL
jgi:hypothetical protein